MEDRRIFSYLEIKCASLLLPRTLGDNLEPKLSIDARQKSIDNVFHSIRAENSSILHKPPCILDSILLAGKVGTKARDSSSFKKVRHD